MDLRERIAENDAAREALERLIEMYPDRVDDAVETVARLYGVA